MQHYSAENPIRIHVTEQGAEIISSFVSESLFPIVTGEIVKSFGFELPTDRDLTEEDIESIVEAAQEINFGTAEHPENIMAFLGKDALLRGLVFEGVAHLSERYFSYIQDWNRLEHNGQVLAAYLLNNEVARDAQALQHMKRFINKAPVMRELLNVPVEIESMGMYTHGILYSYMEEASDHPDIGGRVAHGEATQVAVDLQEYVPLDVARIEVDDMKALSVMDPSPDGVAALSDERLLTGTLYGLSTPEGQQRIIDSTDKNWQGHVPSHIEDDVETFRNHDTLGG